MGGQAEQFGGAEGAPLEITAEHAGPRDAIGDAECGGALLKLGLPAHLIGPGDHQLQAGIVARHGREGLDQQVHPFLGVDAAEEEQDALGAQLGEAAQKQLALLFGIAGRRRGAITHHHLVGLVEPEALAGQPPLLLGGEQHRFGIAQHPVVGPGPVGPLLEVLERIGALEPGIEHPVGVHEIGNAGAAQGAPGGESVVLPDALNNHDIVLQGKDADTGRQPTPVAIAANHRPEANSLKRLILQPGGFRGIQAGHCGAHTKSVQVGGDLADSLRWASTSRVERADDAKQLHETGRSHTNGKVRLQGRANALRPVSTVLAAASSARVPFQARDRRRPLRPDEAPMFS